MTFEEMLDHAMALLQRRGRVTYRALKLQFMLDDEGLEALKDELLYAHPHLVDDDGRGLVWTAEARPTPTPGVPPATDLARALRPYTPPYLAEKILTSKTALEGERKQVTVLFADLKGSMELLADRDPEEARQLLDPVLERMMAAVHRYEGTVNQVLGDGIMALFGAPIAHEDHAVRACYTALAMQEAIRRYSEAARRPHGITVQIRVGLNSGEVVVRAIGNDLHMDYTAVGQTTHLAARMEQLATPGSILLAAETLRLAEGFMQVKAWGPVPVKGLAEPVEVFELVGVTAVRRRLQATAARGLTRFVGRETELAALTQALRESLRMGAPHPQSFSIAGLSAVCLLEGRVGEAGQHARQAVVLARQHGARGVEAFALCQLGAVHAQADPPDAAQAEAHYQQALALAEELGMRPLVAHCHLGLGRLYGQTGHGEEARAALTAAIDLYRAMDMTFWLPQAEAVVAEVEGR